ncbi:unnamed protein product [Kluyveromyces dobzhanskii CBS 2104]|uniref:WGS project CCBQ000000000 data, contig 00104 n=1 Tax=Kluyveromyces dobzhanskii CBS 2104 TaxID=1427455 RepID=A0A0A8L3G9_9SACH|nr:unnamed protein product [Kluyveromyces dobzhanskii CBS 2104]
MAANVNTNKVRNEEFKIWKKTIPSLYEHISTLQPKFSGSLSSAQAVPRSILFGKLISENADKGLLNTLIYYAQRGDIYEISVQLPLGAYKGFENKELPQPKYQEFFSEPTNSRWVFEGQPIVKLKSNSPTSTLIAMSSTASLAWFDESNKQPLKTLKGPSDSQMECDFDVSTDGKIVVKYEVLPEYTPAATKISIINNTDNIGEVIRSITLPNTNSSRCVKFHTANLFSTVSDDNLLRFWDVRAGDEPLCSLVLDSSSTPNSGSNTESETEDDGKITSVESSKFVDTLFLTGSDTGVIKLWDLRSIAAANDKEVKNATELVTLFQTDNDPVVNIQFSPSEPECFVTVGASGNVYHWNIGCIFSENDSQDENANSEESYQDYIQERCLKFLHTGGGRRSTYKSDDTSLIKGSVTQHPLIRNIIATVDDDGYLSVYKGFYGRDGEIEESE